MAETDEILHREPGVDRLDRQLLHVLEIDGRAPFGRIAAVLGSSEQTIARRYRRLRDQGVVRVLCFPTFVAAAQPTLLRLHVQPGAGRPLAAALAKRDDVAWISLMDGGAEIACGLRARTSGSREALLLEHLPRTGRVLGMTALTVLHVFPTPGRAGWDGFPDPLTPQQVAELATNVRTGAAAHARLQAEDDDLLRLLARDGRTSYAALAEQTGRSPAQVARRVEALLASGAVYVDVEIAAQPLGYTTTARVYLRVAPARLRHVGQQLAEHAETAFVGAVTGSVNIVASLVCRDLDHLYTYVTDTLGRMSAIQSVETTVVTADIKQAATLMQGSRLAAG